MGSKFRTSFTSKQGHDPARIVQGRIVNINIVLWTVDVVGQFDRVSYFNVQVGAGYLHFNNGEGMYAFPEVGAKVMVAIPSDSSPPYVQCFLMPHQLIDSSASDAPLGTRSLGKPPLNPSDASFQGNRPAAVPGDIVMRGRDGNSVILHRGGVLSIGASELSQRMYFPLGNLIMDISENYEHNNVAGSIKWGLQEGTSKTQFPASFMQTFRIFANDAAADIRVSGGKFTPLGDPDNGQLAQTAGVGQSDDSPVIYEVAVSPKGFTTETGVPSAGAQSASVFRFAFDRGGNALLRMSGKLGVLIQKSVTFKITGDLTVDSQDSVSITAVNEAIVDGGQLAHIKGQLVRLGAGQLAVARVSDSVQTTLLANAVTIQFGANPVAGAPLPATITTIQPMMGKIVSGNEDVLA